MVASLGIEKLLTISGNHLVCDGRQLESTKEEGAAAREANFEDWNWFFLVCLGSRTVFDGKLGDVEEGEEDGENFMNHEFEIMLATSFISRKNSEEMVHWC